MRVTDLVAEYQFCGSIGHNRKSSLAVGPVAGETQDVLLSPQTRPHKRFIEFEVDTGTVSA